MPVQKPAEGWARRDRRPSSTSREARGALAEEGGDTFGEVGGAARGEEGRLLGLKLLGEDRARRAVEERPHAPVSPGLGRRRAGLG